jgi:penicillin-binding protein 2
MPTGAAAFVMEVNTGKVIVSASIPDFNLNLFAEGISSEDYRELSINPLKPMLNRTVMSAFPPGSIFKLVTGTAAMEELGVRADTSLYDANAAFYLPNWSKPFRNWNHVGEGKLDFVKSIARSNNIVFYELGYDLYKEFRGDKLAEYAKKYGLGSKTDIDLPSEKRGLVPDNSWKRENLNQGWYPGDSVNLSIGQGSLLTTPVQLAQLISVIASEGKSYQPQIVDKIVSPDGEIVKEIPEKINIDLREEVSKKTFKALKQGMYDVVNKEYGTAHRHFRDYPLDIAGKTGTAQTSTALSNHAWFGGFAPFEEPEIAVVVLLENGGSSAYSVPIAKEIIDYYFGFKNLNNGSRKIYYYDNEE